LLHLHVSSTGVVCYIFFAVAACVQYGSEVLHILCCVLVCQVYIFFAASACVQYGSDVLRILCCGHTQLNTA